MARAGLFNCLLPQCPSLVAKSSPPKSEDTSSPSLTQSVHEGSVQADAMQSKSPSNDLFGITSNLSARSDSRAPRALHFGLSNGPVSSSARKDSSVAIAVTVGVHCPCTANGGGGEEEGERRRRQKEEDSSKEPRTGSLANKAVFAATSTLCPRSYDPSTYTVGSNPNSVKGQSRSTSTSRSSSCSRARFRRSTILPRHLPRESLLASHVNAHAVSSSASAQTSKTSHTFRCIHLNEDHSQVTSTNQGLDSTTATSDVDPNQQLLQFNCISNNNNTTTTTTTISSHYSKSIHDKNNNNNTSNSNSNNIFTQSTGGEILNSLEPSGDRDGLKDTLVNTSTCIDSNPSSRQESTIYNSSNIHNLPCDSAVNSIGRTCACGNLLQGTSYFDTSLTQSVSSSISPLTLTACTILPEALTTKTSTSTPVSDLVTQVSSVISPSISPFLHDPLESGDVSLAKKQTGSILVTSLTPNVETYEETPSRQLQAQRAVNSCVLAAAPSFSFDITKNPHFINHRQEVNLALLQEQKQQSVYPTREAVIRQQQQQQQLKPSPSTPPTDQSNQKHLENLPQDHQRSPAITTIGRGIATSSSSSSCSSSSSSSYEPEDTLWQQTKVDHLTQSSSHQTESTSTFTQSTCNVDTKSSKPLQPLVPNEQLPSKRSPSTTTSTTVAGHSPIMRMDESISIYESHPATQSTPSTGQQQILPSNITDLHMSSDAVNADVTLTNVSSSIDSIDGSGNAIAFASNTSDHCNNNDLDISNALSHPGPSPYLTSVAVTTSNNLVDTVSFLPAAPSTTNTTVNNSNININITSNSNSNNNSNKHHLTDSAVVDSIVTLPMSSMSPVTSMAVAVAPSPTNGDEPSQAIASMVDMAMVDSKTDSRNIVLLPPSPSPPTPQLADGTDQVSAGIAPMTETSNAAIDVPLTTVTMYAPSPSPSPSLSSTSSSCGKEDFKHQSRIKKSTPPVASASSSTTSNTNVPVTVTNSVASPAPGKSLKSSTSTTKGKSGMGCGRPGYITCSICSATKYYSHVQRRFGQFSCEPCSKFMKRFLRDPKKFTCFESGNCSIGRPSGEQEPRGVSVSRCKACWLKICLEKFVLESNIREVIEQHYLPVFLTGPSGTSISPSSTTLASSASTTSTNATHASSACTSSNSTCSTGNTSTSGSNSSNGRNKNSCHFATASEPLLEASLSNNGTHDDLTGYHPSLGQQPPPLPLPQRKRKPKGQAVFSEHDQSSNIFTSNLNPNPNTVLPPSYSPSSSSISSTASSSLGTAVRNRSARSPRKGPTTVKYKKCEQKPARNSNSRSNRHNSRGKGNATVSAGANSISNSSNNIINSNNNNNNSSNNTTTTTANSNTSYTASNHRSNSYNSHQGGYLLTPPADSDNEMDSYVADVGDEGGSVNLRDTSESNFIITSSSALFRPIAPCVNTNSNVTRGRAFQGTSKRIRGDGTSVKVKSNSEILTLPYPKSSLASSVSPFAENISPEKMILGKRSRGAKGVIGYNHDHDYGASHETDEVDEEEEEEEDENDWANSCTNVQYSAGSEEDATEDEYDEEEDEIDDDDSFHRRTIRQRTSTVRRIHRPRNKVTSLRKVSKVDASHVSGSNCANGFTGGNVTAASAIDSCDELIDESYIKSQTDLPEYLATLASTSSSTSTTTTTSAVTSSNTAGSRVKKFKSEPDSPKAATKAEESIGELDHSFYSTSDLLNQELIGEARDFNATPNVKGGHALPPLQAPSTAKSRAKSTRATGTRASGKRKSNQLEQSLPSTSSAFTCPSSAKGPRKTSLNSYSNASTMSNLLSSGGRFVRLKESTVLDASSPLRHHLNSLSSTASSSEFCDFIDYNGNSSSELLHSSTSGHQMLHQIDEDDEGYDDYFDPLVNTAREARDSLFFDEILNTNSPFL